MNIPEHQQKQDLRGALRDADALDQFEALPPEEQERFRTWISKSQDQTAYWRRIDILVMGMRMAPRIGHRKAHRAEPGLWLEPKSL